MRRKLTQEEFINLVNEKHNNKYDYTILKPRYFWVDIRTLQYYHRNQTQKSKLESTFDSPLLETDTETSYMERLGYIKVYDNGLAKLHISL